MQYPIDSTHSPWQRDLDPSLEPLTESTEADVVIVGAGIAGMSIAYELAMRGRSVVVLDDGPIGGGETSRTTAHLVNALDSRYRLIEEMHGEEASRMAAASHTAAVGRVEEICRVENIECDFLRLDGYLLLPPEKRDDADRLIGEEHAAAARAGVVCQRLARAPGLAVDSGPCLRFPDQAQFHPMKYLRGLERSIKALGGRIFTGSHVSRFQGGKDASVTTADGRTVRAGLVVVATNTPVNDLVTMHTKQVAYRSYVIAVEIARNALPPALYWDGFWESDDESYHYVRLQLDPSSERDLLIVGGEDHRVGDDPGGHDRFGALERWTRERFPMAQEVRFRWSGQIMEPFDEFGYLGRNPGDDKNVYIVTGDSGNGMTHAVIASMMFPILMAGEPHPWEKIYSPSRLPRRALKDAIVGNLEAASEYRDWVLPHATAKGQPAASGRGSGEVAKVNGKLCVVYTAPDGGRRVCSAACTHLKGVLRWNPTEQTWDCPVHGSRFDHDGRVVNGPANEDLPEAEDPPEIRVREIGKVRPEPPVLPP